MANQELREAEAAIRNQFPELNIRSIDSLGEGHRNFAVLANGEWVFRFPKSRQGAEELRKELQLLPLLAGHVPVAIPRFEYVGMLNDDAGSPFVGYRMVPGDILGEDGVPALPDAQRNRLARRLAAFMDALTDFPVEAALQAGVPVRSVPDETAMLRDDAERRLFPMLSEEVRSYVVERFRTYLTHPQLTSYAPALLHGDLSPDHYLTDARTGELTGVIDFGDAAVGDPDYDYVYVLEDGGEPFARQVMAHRGVADIDARIRKILLFVTFDQVRYLLDGVEAGDEDRIGEAADILEADMRHNRT